MPKNKPNKGLLKRIRVTKSGKIKFRRAGGRHRRSHKSGTLLQSYRRPCFAGRSEARRLGAMLFISSSIGHKKKTASADTADD